MCSAETVRGHVSFSAGILLLELLTCSLYNLFFFMVCYVAKILVRTSKLFQITTVLEFS